MSLNGHPDLTWCAWSARLPGEGGLGLPLVAIYVAVAVLYVPLIWPF